MIADLYTRTVPNVIRHYGCSVEDARRYIELRDEGYSTTQAALMAGLIDPPGDDHIPSGLGAVDRVDSGAGSESVHLTGAVQSEGASVSEARWIPVTERMPEPGTECVVWCREYAPGCGPFYAIDRWGEGYEALVGWSSIQSPVGLGWDNHDFDEITHWMPLPAPPAAATGGKTA